MTDWYPIGVAVFVVFAIWLILKERVRPTEGLIFREISEEFTLPLPLASLREAERDIARLFDGSGVSFEAVAVADLGNWQEGGEDRDRVSEIIGKFLISEGLKNPPVNALVQFLSTGAAVKCLEISSSLPLTFRNGILQPHRTVTFHKKTVNLEICKYLKATIFGFVGTPVLGDRPSQKCTPFGIKISSDCSVNKDNEISVKLEIFPAKNARTVHELIAQRD